MKNRSIKTRIALTVTALTLLMTAMVGFGWVVALQDSATANANERLENNARMVNLGPILK